MADLKTPKSVNWHGLNDSSWRMTEKGATESYLSGTREETVTYRGEPGAGDTQRGLTRGEKFSNVIAGFIVIVLLASLLFVPSFLTDLEVFLPTETKTIDENGVVHYEVTSNWETADVMNIGEKSMQVFTSFGSFIQNLGDTLGSVFGLIGNVTSDSFSKVDGPRSDWVFVDYYTLFDNEQEFWTFICWCETLHGITSDPQAVIYREYVGGNQGNIWYVPVTTLDYYNNSVKSSLSWQVTSMGWLRTVFYDWTAGARNEYYFFRIGE